MRSPDREVIPRILNRGDPCAQDEALFTAGNFENWRRYGGGTGDEEAWEREERRFHAAYLGVLGGERAWEDPDLLDAAGRLGVDAPRHHDARPGRVAEVTVSDEVLCDVVEDAVPELLMLLERVTGQAGMPARPPLGAVAVLGFIHCGVEGTRPIEGWMDEEPDRELVRSVRVVDDAPMSLWSREPWRGTWTDGWGPSLLPVAPRLRPGADDPAWGGLPPVFLGRAYRVAQPGGEAGWAFANVLAPSARVPAAALGAVAEVLTRRMTLELWDLRRTERRATFEDVLRHRPEVVCRSALELLRAWSPG